MRDEGCGMWDMEYGRWEMRYGIWRVDSSCRVGSGRAVSCMMGWVEEEEMQEIQ